jgi:acyl-homoserine lactone acylase PvdQ
MRAYLIALRILQNEEAEWLTDKDGNAQTGADILAGALSDAMHYLEGHVGRDMHEWEWGRLHRASFNHPLGAVKPLDKIFNRGPFPYGGDTSTVWQAGFIPQMPIPDDAVRVSKAIDAEFANSPYETKTETESAFAANWVKQFGNIQFLIVSIGTVVFFTLLLVTGNTMAISVRERTSELAVFKAIGYSDRAVLFKVMEILPAVEAWRETLPPIRRWRQPRYCGRSRMSVTRANAPGIRSACQKSCRPRLRPAGSGGESGDPKSPHFSDQALMFTQGNFRDVLFYPTDVAAHAERSYHP